MRHWNGVIWVMVLELAAARGWAAIDPLLSTGTRNCDRELRKTFESVQAWRRLHSGQYPYRLVDLKSAGLMDAGGAICPGVLAEAPHADPAHPLATSRTENGDPPGTYEYEMCTNVAKSKIDSRWLPSRSPYITRRDLKVELLKRPFFEQVTMLRCSSHRDAAPRELASEKIITRNLPLTGQVYWSGEFWEQQFLEDVPYCAREVNVLFGLKGPPFHSGTATTLDGAVDLRNWSNAFGDHPWWWTFPVFDEQPNRQAAPQLKPFFEQRPGRVVEVAGSKWWLDGLVQLQGRILTNPTRVYDEPGMLAFVWQRTALPIGKSFKSASWLQASVWAAPAGDVAGWLVWHYSDASVERVPVIYGKTTGRFWGDSQQIKSETAFPEPVWSFHENAAAVGKERWLRIYRQTWDNPHPAVRVISLDFVSNRASPAAPFLIALNLSE